MPNLTTTQVAQHLKVSGSRVRALIAAGRLSAEKVGRDWVIQQSDLDAFVPRKAGRPKTIKAATAGHEAHSAGSRTQSGQKVTDRCSKSS